MKSFFTTFQKQRNSQKVSEKGFFETLRSSRLTREEKDSIREHLQLIVRTSSSQQGVSVFWDAFMSRRSWLMATLVLSLLVPGSWGIVRAAGAALPGDAWYFVKVEVSEPAAGWWHYLQGSQAQWERERAKRRVQEAEQLAEQGRLTEAKKQMIDTLVERHRATLGKYSQETDAEFIAELNRDTKRMRMVIEEEKGKKRYRLVESEDKQEGLEGRRGQHEQDETDDANERSEFSEQSFDDEEQEGKMEQSQRDYRYRLQYKNQDSSNSKASVEDADTRDRSQKDNDSSEDNEEKTSEEEDADDEKNDDDERDDEDNDEEDEEKGDEEEKSDHSGQN